MTQLIEERIRRFNTAAGHLKGAKAYYREDWDVYYFDIEGKMFGLMSTEPKEDAIITLKGLPEDNEIVREQYSDVSPGYHTNKVHWNSIKLMTEQLTNQEIEQLIIKSYQLVYSKLPKKVRNQIESDSETEDISE